MSVKGKGFTLALGYIFLLIGIKFHVLGYFLFVLWIFFCFYKYQLVTVPLMILVIVLCHFTYFTTSIEGEEFSGTIIDQSDYGVVLDIGRTNIKVNGDFSSFDLGDKLDVKVKESYVTYFDNDHGFDYRTTLLTKNIAGAYYLLEIESYEHHFSFTTLIQERIAEANEDIQGYLSLFLLGESDDSVQEIYTDLTTLSMIHLFALSGMHLSMLKQWIAGVLHKFTYSNIVDYLLLLFTFLYVSAIPFHISFTRALIMLIIDTLFSKYCNRLDSLGISAIIILFFNGYRLISASFLFSYIMTLAMILCNECKATKLVLYLTSIFLAGVLKYTTNLLGYFFAFAFNGFVEMLYGTCLLFLVFGKIFTYPLKAEVYVLETCVYFLKNVPGKIAIPYVPIFISGVYVYFLLRMIYHSNTGRRVSGDLIFLLIVLCFWKISPNLNAQGMVVMMDVGQGDCFLIHEPYNRNNILIDTGGLESYDVATNILIPYFNSLGIDHFDAIYLSHGDYDHSGAYDTLVQSIPTEKKIDTYEEYREIGNVKIRMYQADNIQDSNEASLCMSVEVNGLHYFFCGDIDTHVEQELYKKYKKIKCDILKAPHHGSNSSSSTDLLKLLTPKAVLISVGRHNRYGHPSDSVIERYEHYGIAVYRTDTMGMVKICYFENGKNYIFT